MTRALLIIPAYNEEANILGTIQAIEDFRDKVDLDLDYIVVDDGSSDSTLEVCKRAQVPVIHLRKNLGIGGAVQTGYILADRQGYDLAIQFDGDGQHDILSLPDLLRPLLEGQADMTVGSRFVGSSSDFKSTGPRRMGIGILSWAVRLASGLKIYDVTSGYRACKRDLIKHFALDYPTDYPEPESLVTVTKLGFRVQEVGVRMFERQGGQSSITPLKSIYYMVKVSLAILIGGLKAGRKGSK